MREAIAKGASDAVGSWKAVAVGGSVFLAAVAIARWWFHSEEVADDAMVWTGSVLMGTGVVLLPLVAWNAISLPAKREQELQDTINTLQPNVDSLTAGQWDILDGCNKGGPTEEHWLDSESGMAKLDGRALKTADGGVYNYEYVQGQLEYMERLELLDITNYGQCHRVFQLKPAVCDLLQKRAVSLVH